MIPEPDRWPEGISNGLELPCAICGETSVKFDYLVRDELWEIVIPKQYRRDVVCLPCYDQLATEKGIDWVDGLKEVQFTGIGKTIGLVPVFLHRYEYAVTLTRREEKDDTRT